MSRMICIFGFLLSSVAGHTVERAVLSPTRYELSFDIDYVAEVLHAGAKVEMQNTSSTPARQVSLLLYRLLRVRNVRNENGGPLPFTQNVVTFEDDGKLQVNQILITLPAPLAAGRRVAVQLQYDGALLGYAETGSQYIQDRIDPEFTILREDAYAYPIPGYPSHSLIRQHITGWRFDYTARNTVPKDLTVANGGKLEGTDALQGRVTFRYSSLKPSWRMDFAIAKYETLSSLTIRTFYLPGDKEGAMSVVAAAEKALELYTLWFGPRRQTMPLTFIEIPDGWGSQADVTAILQTAPAFRDTRQHRQVYHEISHLWNVADLDRPSPRWNEGLASFLEYLVDEEVTGEPRIDARASRILERLRTQLPQNQEWRKVPLVHYGVNGLTDLSYSVGAMFFDLLYRVVGRENFNKILGAYFSRYADGGTTNDLVGVIRKTADTDVSRLIDDWITTTGWTSRIEHITGLRDLEACYRQ